MTRDENWKENVDTILESVSEAKQIIVLVKGGYDAYRLGKYLFNTVKENWPEIKQKSYETIEAVRDYCDRLAEKIIRAYEKALKTVQDTTKAAKKAVEYILG